MFSSQLSVLRLGIAAGIWMASEKYLAARQVRNGKVVNLARTLGCFLFQPPDYFAGQTSSGLSPAAH